MGASLVIGLGAAEITWNEQENLFLSVFLLLLSDSYFIRKLPGALSWG